MKKYILFLLMAVFAITNAGAQDNGRKPSYAQRYIKLGNTLREAQQYDLSEKYLRQALQMVSATGDRYWEAAAYENLGFLYKDQDKPDEAALYFNKALTLYQLLKMSL